MASPAEKLDVDGNLRLSGASTAGRIIEVGTGRTDIGYAFIDLVGDTTYTDYGVRLIRMNTGPNAESRIMHRGTGSLVLMAQDSASISLKTGGTERMRVSETGNVGIGTSNPAAKLEIEKNGATTFRLTRTNSTSNFAEIEASGSNGEQLTIKSNVSNQTGGFTSFDVGGSERMRIDSSGNIGIGVTSPSQKLEVLGNAILKGVSTEPLFLEIGTGRTGNGTSYIDLIGDGTYTDYGARFIRAHTGPNATTAIRHRGTGTLTLLTEEAAAITLRTTDTERMRVSETGNVGVGTNSPSYKLDVAGTIHSSTGGFRFPDGSTQTTAGLEVPNGKSIAFALIFG